MIRATCIIAVIATLAVFVNAATNYCSLKSCNGPNHTICKYGFLNVNRNNCGNPKSTGLTTTEIQEILNLHNSYRTFVGSGQESRGKPGPQPAATNLGGLSWDRELANIAQSWADQCAYGHDQCRDSERFPVGQNVAWQGSTGGYNGKFTDLVSAWYNEVKDFDRNQVRSVTDFNGVGHYTQMMWADTKLLGCGGVRYKDGQWYKTYLVCNYGPTGNWVGGQMYNPR